MDCNKAQEFMSLMFDDVLTKNEINELQQHIEDCSECREEYELYQSINISFTMEEAASLPDGFHDELMSKIDVLAAKDYIDEQNIKVNDSVSRVHEGSEVIDLESAKEQHNRKMSHATTKKKFYQRNYKQFNIAAVIVLILIFGLIGITNLENILHLEDTTEEMTMSTSTSDTAMEEKKTEAKMEMGEVTEESSVATTSEPQPKSKDAAKLRISKGVEESNVSEVVVTEFADAEPVENEEAAPMMVVNVQSEGQSESIVAKYGSSTNEDAVPTEASVDAVVEENQLAKDNSIESHRFTAKEIEETTEQVAVTTGKVESNSENGIFAGIIVGFVVLGIGYFIFKKRKD